jgi:hypothetical protein
MILARALMNYVWPVHGPPKDFKRQDDESGREEETDSSENSHNNEIIYDTDYDPDCPKSYSVENIFEPVIKHKYHPGYTIFLTVMIVSLTVGKVDAGMAVLLTEDKRIVGISNWAADIPQLQNTDFMVSLPNRLSSRLSCCRQISRSALSSTSPSRATTPPKQSPTQTSAWSSKTSTSDSACVPLALPNCASAMRPRPPSC